MPRYRTVFISHAHADNARCARIAASLKAKGIDVWIDLTNAQQGHDLSAEINDQLVQRTAFVLIVTETSNASPWVRQERGAYNMLVNSPKNHSVNGVERIILPVRLSDEVPAILGGILWIEAENKLDERVADEIATALTVADWPQPVSEPANFIGSQVQVPVPAIVTPQPASPGRDWEEIGVSARHYDLGFRGWRAPHGNVSFMLPPMCDVPAGAFLMGSADGDHNARDNEQPQYRIPVGAFAIGGYPVTVAEYAHYLVAHPGTKDAIPKGGDNDFYGWKQQQARPNHPVVNITWFNARDYAAWLAQVTGQPWRLPTEAEWEKAARWDVAQQYARRYPWGDNWDPTRANTEDGGPGHSTPVGSYPNGASPCGAQDMSGNVWEWCSSLYASRYPYDRASCEDAGKDKTSVRVFRGGSWLIDSRVARPAFRVRYISIGAVGYGGFRVARGVGAGESRPSNSLSFNL